MGSDNEYVDIFKPERRFSAVFNTFLDEGCAKKYEHVFKLALGSLLFPKFL